MDAPKIKNRSHKRYESRDDTDTNGVMKRFKQRLEIETITYETFLTWMHQ